MRMKTTLGSATLAVMALLVAGIAYWALRENPQLVAPSDSAGAPPVAPQPTAPPAPPGSQSTSTTPTSQATAPPAPASQSASTAPAPEGPSSPAVITQPNQPAASPATSPAPPTSPANAEQGQPPVLSPTTPAARRITLPPENQMSEADRRQIQKMLQGMKHYQGPINGKFGPLTRAAIRRYQDSIGAKSTGYLTAEEATRLASTR